MEPIQELFISVDIEADEYANQAHDCIFGDWRPTAIDLRSTERRALLL